jgi:hypothetical protein
MKKELRSALQSLCDEAMAELSPEARRLKRLPKGSGYPGEIVFGHVLPGFAAFTSFVPVERSHAFTVELGWSLSGVFPTVGMRPSVGPEQALASPQPAGFVRLSEFYDRSGPVWDVAPINALDPSSFQRFMELEMRTLDPDEAVALLRPLMRDAAERWSAHALDFFAALQSRLETRQ